MAYPIAIPAPDISVKRREPFLSDSINDKLGVVVPEGVYRGFLPIQSPVSPQNATLYLDDSGFPNYDHVAVVRNSSGRSVTIRCPPVISDSPSQITINLAPLSLPGSLSSPVTMVIAISASYDTVSATSASFFIMSENEWDGVGGTGGLTDAQRDTFVALGRFKFNGNSEPLSDISLTNRTRAGDNISIEAAPRVELLRNNNFSLGSSEYSDNSASPGSHIRSIIPFWAHEPSNTGKTSYPYIYPDKYALWSNVNGMLRYTYLVAGSSTDTAYINQSLGVPLTASNTLKMKLVFKLVTPLGGSAGPGGTFSINLNFISSSGVRSTQSFMFCDESVGTTPPNPVGIFEQEYQCVANTSLDSVSIAANNIYSDTCPNNSEMLSILSISVSINPLDLAAPASIMSTRIGDIMRARTFVLDNHTYAPSAGSAARLTIDESSSPGTVVLSSTNTLDTASTPAAPSTQPNLHIRGNLTVDGVANLTGGYTAVSSIDAPSTGGHVSVGITKADHVDIGHSGNSTEVFGNLKVDGTSLLVGNTTISGNTKVQGTLTAGGVTTGANLYAIHADGNITTNSGFYGALIGNASTSTALQTARNIAGSSFNGTSDINIYAGNLSGSTLNSGVIDSSLTSVGTLTTLSVGPGGITTAGTIITNSGFYGALTGVLIGNASTSTALETARNIAGSSFNGTYDINIYAGNLSGSTLNSGVIDSSLTSVGTLTTLSVGSGGITTIGDISTSGAPVGTVYANQIRTYGKGTGAASSAIVCQNLYAQGTGTQLTSAIVSSGSICAWGTGSGNDAAIYTGFNITANGVITAGGGFAGNASSASYAPCPTSYIPLNTTVTCPNCNDSAAGIVHISNLAAALFPIQSVIAYPLCSSDAGGQSRIFTATAENSQTPVIIEFPSFTLSAHPNIDSTLYFGFQQYNAEAGGLLGPNLFGGSFFMTGWGSSRIVGPNIIRTTIRGPFSSGTGYSNVSVSFVFWYYGSSTGEDWNNSVAISYLPTGVPPVMKVTLAG